jgi:hypothetical protein
MRAALHLPGAGMAWRIRLPAFLAGAASLFLAGLLARRIFAGNAAGSLLALALVAGSGALIHFSQTARGYALQLALLLALGLVLERLFREPPGSGAGWRWAAGTVPLAAAALLTVPTSFMYVGLLLGCFAGARFLAWRRRQRRSAIPFAGGDWLVLAGGGLLMLGWLGLEWPALQAGRSRFGLPITGPWQWLKFAGQTLAALAPWPVLGLAALGVAGSWRRGWTWLGLALVLGPLLGAVATAAGEARVYLPLLPPLFLLATQGALALADRLPHCRPGGWRPWLAAALAVLALAAAPAQVAAWTPPAWAGIFAKLEAELPANLWTLYPATAGQVIRFHHAQEAGARLHRRLGRVPAALAQAGGSEDALNVASLRDFGALSLPVPQGCQRHPMATGMGVAVTLYPLRELGAAGPAETLLVARLARPPAAKFMLALAPLKVAAGPGITWGVANVFLPALPPAGQPGQRLELLLGGGRLTLADRQRLRELQRQAPGSLWVGELAPGDTVTATPPP